VHGRPGARAKTDFNGGTRSRLVCVGRPARPQRRDQQRPRGGDHSGAHGLEPAAGRDGAFSLEPEKFKAMVDAVRVAEKALGSVQFAPAPSEASSRRFRRSLFVVEDVNQGELFTERNVRSIRPAEGLHPRAFHEVLGKCAARDVERGTALSSTLVSS